MTRRAQAVAAVLAFVALLAAAPAALAQRRPAPPAEHSPFLEGTHAVRRIFYDGAGKKLKPLKELPPGPLEPGRMLIVVLGDPRPLDSLNARLPGGLCRFVIDGGALLVATDQKTPGVLADCFGVAVSGTQLTIPGGGDDAYRGMPECPYVHPVHDAEPPLFTPNLPALGNQSARRIASNLPSYLHLTRSRFVLPTLANLGDQCTDGRGQFTRPFAAGGEFGLGRILILADHSIFINEMMLQTDNGNLDFAYRCADWMLGRANEPRGRRDQVLYLEDDRPQTDFNIPLRNLPTPPLPPPETLLGLLDETLHEMEKEGTFARMEEDDLLNEVIDNAMTALPFWERTQPEGKIWTLAVIAATLSLGLYAVVRLGMFRHRPDTSGPVLATLLAQPAPAGAVLAQRHEALLRDGNLWEAARELARHLFVAAGASQDAGPAILEVRGPWWRRWLTRRHWGQLRRLARSARPMRVSPRGFARLAQRVRALQAALDDGTVRIVP